MSRGARINGATALPGRPADLPIVPKDDCSPAHMSDGAWFGVSKVPLTVCTSQGKDALMTDVPSGVIDVLRVVCPELLVVVSALP